MIYLIVIILLLCLSLRYDINGKTKYRKEWYGIMLFIFILIAGLRYRIGVDTVGYLYTYYHNTPNLSYYLGNNLLHTNYLLWNLLLSFFYTIGVPFYVVQLFTAAFVNFLLFSYIKKHSYYVFTCLFFYFIGFYPIINFETMKASYAIAISLFANDFFIEGKSYKGFLLYIIAALFHPSTIALIVVPLLLFLRFNFIGLIFLVIAFVGGFIIQKSLGDYLLSFDVFGNDVISDKLEGYAESDYYGSSMRFLSIIKNLPLILYSFISVKFAIKSNCHNKLLVLEPYLMLTMFFLVLQFNIYVFYRIYDFFLIYYCLFFSQLFVDMAKCSIFQRLLSYTRALFFILPLVLIFLWKYQSESKLARYYPYATVIEKRIDNEREKVYNQLRNGKMANYDEY